MSQRYRYYFLTGLVSALCCAGSFGQVTRKTLNVSECREKVLIDGSLSEPIWGRAAKATDFVQYRPFPGDACTQRSEVSILYDNDAVYIGAMLYDEHPDSILKQLSTRDDDGGNTDVFGVYFDTYSDRQNAVRFGVTAAGVQVDAISKFDGANSSWNAAWYSRVAINEKGWCVEMKIPYSALRFPKKQVQEWGVNFVRGIRRNREISYWNAVVPGVSNITAQSGKLEGIHDIKSPLRLSLLPYVSAYAENYAGENAHSINGGMDVKYGFNESFTLDITLVPDFGQTIYDNKVLNLSPVEVRYDERRYFFTEGLDLFNKNDLFYSRRVGGAPVNLRNVSGAFDTAKQVLQENPTTTRLYNATKVSGRTKGNLGIGLFNAVSAPAYALIKEKANDSVWRYQTSPLTNYNVIVLDQALKNNSYISLINTNVTRKENSYNADVSALLFKFANRSNTYGVSGSGDVSQLFYASSPVVGYRYYFDMGRISGNNTWSLKTRRIDDKFNPNDLGYLDKNNVLYYAADYYNNIYKPTGIINSGYSHIGVDYYGVVNPGAFVQGDIFGSHNIVLKNYMTVGGYWVVQPWGVNDYYEPRTPGRFYRSPEDHTLGGFISSDYRKKFALDAEVNNKWFMQQGRNTLFWSLSPRYRFSDRFSLIYSFNWQLQKGDAGFVKKRNDSVFFGVRKIETITNAIDATYIFTSKMSLKLNARHYWSQAAYSRYALLMSDGTLAEATYSGNHDINFNTLNVYMSYVWQFRPGSEMSVVYQNSVYSSGQKLEPSYVSDINNTLQQPLSNSLSIKMIYYLDYLEVRSLLRKNS